MVHSNQIIETLLILMKYLPPKDKLPCNESIVQTFICDILTNKNEIDLPDHIHLSKTWIENDEDSEDIGGYKYIARKKNYVYQFILNKEE